MGFEQVITLYFQYSPSPMRNHIIFIWLDIRWLWIYQLVTYFRKKQPKLAANMWVLVKDKSTAYSCACACTGVSLGDEKKLFHAQASCKCEF